MNLSLSRLRQLDWNVWKPRLGYGAFFVLAFVLAFRQTFPVEALKERLILEASARGWQVDSADVGPAGIVGMRATDVVLEDRAGLRLSLDEVAVSFRLLPLLVGRASVSYDVRLWDGRIEGTADVGDRDRRVAATLKGIDLARAAPLRQALRLELLGTLSGAVDVTLPKEPAAKPTGRVELAVAEAGVNGGQLPLPGMSQPLSIPRVGLGALSTDLVFAEGKGTFEKLQARDGDAELKADGLYFVPQARLASSPIYGKLGVRIADAFLDRPGNAPFKALLDLALRGARGKDGFYRLQLYGSLGSPQARPVSTAGVPGSFSPPAGAMGPDAGAPPQPPVAEPTGADPLFPAGRPPRMRLPRPQRSE
ncbi:MAG TPA: type II secretion system protein GspN [Anaeromyxobacteraceae bacterium]|nr:type II secretion system protein GspN [Anaeromyxobacteraceae bacterium]